MRKAKISQLFLLFTGLSCAAEWDDLIDAAILKTKQMLRDHADETDIRLCYLAAAQANLQYRQIVAARASAAPTYAGNTAAARDDSAQCTLAQKLVSEYRLAAAALLRDDAFVFQTIPESGGASC
ncbi:MAG: hypothetical protein IKI58_11580 [Oscillospiraceae bacterium]|nr:hypothetical protein [Oscillospiraceae bacterium]